MTQFEVLKKFAGTVKFRANWGDAGERSQMDIVLDGNEKRERLSSSIRVQRVPTSFGNKKILIGDFKKNTRQKCPGTRLSLPNSHCTFFRPGFTLNLNLAPEIVDGFTRHLQNHIVENQKSTS